MFNLILKAFLAYIEKNPAVIEQLIGEAITAIINALKTKNAGQ